MPRLLAIATVGGQDVQGDLWDEFVQQRIGPEHKTRTREIARELANLDDADLVEMLRNSVVRNEPCFAELDQRAPEGWTLALLATDQKDPKRRSSDSIDLARELRRWFSLTRPHVTVLEPYAITRRPDRADDDLRDEIFALVRAAVSAARPQEVAVLPAGGTPAMRIFTELAAGDTAPRGRLTRLLPDPDGSDQPHEQSLLRLIQADQIRTSLADGVVKAAKGARYRTAGALVQQMATNDLLAPEAAASLTALCDLAVRVAEDVDPWVPPDGLPEIDPDVVAEVEEIRNHGASGWESRLEARIALIQRSLSDRRRMEAVGQWLVAAEFLPVVWATQLVDEGDLRPLADLPVQGDCRERYHRRVPPPAQLPGEAKKVVGIARAAAACASLQCKACPLAGGSAPPAAGRLMADGARASAASFLRDTGVFKVTELRNSWSHAQGPRTEQQRDLDTAVAAERDGLKRLGVTVDGGLESLLAAVFKQITGRRAADPFAPIDKAIERALRRLPE